MLSSMLKHLVPKFRPDLSVRLKDIAEKQVPAKMKPMEEDDLTLANGERGGTNIAYGASFANF